MYIDYLNLVGTPEELMRIEKYLKNEFEMKDLRKTTFCLGLQTKHFPTEVLVKQSPYTKEHPLSSPMVVHSLDVKK